MVPTERQVKTAGPHFQVAGRGVAVHLGDAVQHHARRSAKDERVAALQLDDLMGEGFEMQEARSLRIYAQGGGGECRGGEDGAIPTVCPGHHNKSRSYLPKTGK